MPIKNRDGALWMATGIDNSGLYAGLNAAEVRVDQFGDYVTKAGKKIGTALGVGLGVAGLKELGQEVINVRSQFQQLEIAFGTMLKSPERATKLMSELQTFAAQTPFGMESAATGAKQLIAYGSAADDVISELTMLGDVAAGTGQQIGDLVYLYGTLRMQGRAYQMDINQFAGRGIPIYKELANVLQINESQVRSFVEAGKVGFKEVEQAFKNMTSNGGMYGGLMSDLSKSWTGQIEELKDNVSVIFNEIGKASDGAFTTTMKGINLLVANYEKVGEVLVSLIATYGAYKAAIAFNTAMSGAISNVKLVEEAKGLEALITGEQKAVISKKNLTKGTVEYATAVRSAALANVESAKASVASLGAEASAMNKSMIAAKARAAAAADLVAKRRLELIAAQQSGSATRIAAAQKKLDTAITNENTAVLQKNAAMKQFYSQKAKIQAASQTAATITTKADTAAASANVTATKFLTLAKTQLITVTKTLWATLAGNPLALVTAGVVALGFGIYKLATHQSEAEKIQSRLNDSMREAQKSALSEQRELAKLKGELDGTTKGTKEYNDIKDKIISKFGQYDKNLKNEIETVGLLDSTYKNLTESIRKSFSARQYEAFANEQAKYLDDVLSTNLEKIQDRLLKELGDEKGSEYYAKIRDALIQNTELSADVINVINEVQDKGTILADSRLDSYINNIREATKATEEFDKKAKIRLGFEEKTSTNTGASDEVKTITDEIKTATEETKRLNKEIDELRKGERIPDSGKTIQQSIDERLKSVKEYQSALETLTGVSEKQSKVEAEAAKGSVAFLNKMIADAKSNFESATTDESRTMYSKLIKDLEDQLKTVQERIALAGADVVTEALQGAIKGVKVVSGAYDTAVKIGGNTVDTSGLKRLVEKNAPSLMDSLFKSADKMAVSSIIKLLNQAKEASKQAFNPADAKAYQDAIEKLETELRQRSPFKAISEDWGSLMTSIKNGDKDGIAAAATGLSQGIGNVQGQLEQIAGGIGEIFGEEAGYAAQQVTELTGAIAGFASGASKLASGDILGGITDVVSSVGKIFSMSRRTKEMNEAARKEVQDYYDTAIKGEREYQALLRQRAREAAEADRKTLESFKNTMDELSKQSNSIQAEYDKVWSALMGEEYVSGRGYKHGTWLRKAKTWDIMSSLNGLSYDDIEKLYTEGKLKDNAKELFEQLRDLKEEGLDVNEMLKDQAEALNEYASGMTFDSLRDSIKDAFSDGRMDIQESADFTRDAFKKAMLQALEAKVLNKALEPFLESFTKDATEGTLFGKMDYYENWIRQIGEEGNKFMESLTSLPGLSDIFSSSSSDNTLKGAFAKASQESIDLLAGQMGAGRIAWDKTAVNTDSIRESINAALELSRQKLEEVKAIRVLTEKIEQSNAAIQATNEKVAENTDGINSIAQSLKDISTHGLDLK